MVRKEGLDVARPEWNQRVARVCVSGVCRDRTLSAHLRGCVLHTLGTLSGAVAIRASYCITPVKLP